MGDWGHRLRQALRRRRVGKLYVLALEIGVNESALTRWKKGDAISTANAVRLCQVLDISLDWLLLGRGTMDLHKPTTTSAADDLLVEQVRALPPEAAASLSDFLRQVAAR